MYNRKKININSPREVATRLKIYREARDFYVKQNEKYADAETSPDHWRRKTEGMCQAIDNVRSKNDRRHRCNTREEFPEYFSFKPSTTWREDSSYWFTRYFKRGGYEKRVSILTALADGKTYEQWRKERKAAGFR